MTSNLHCSIIYETEIFQMYLMISNLPKASTKMRIIMHSARRKYFKCTSWSQISTIRTHHHAFCQKEIFQMYFTPSNLHHRHFSFHTVGEKGIMYKCTSRSEISINGIFIIIHSVRREHSNTLHGLKSPVNDSHHMLCQRGTHTAHNAYSKQSTYST